MMIFIILLILNLTLLADDFRIQKDSYFQPLRTKIFWNLGSGLGNSSGIWFKKGSPEIDLNFEFLRLVGRVKPEDNIIEFFYLSVNTSYYNFENNYERKQFIVPLSLVGGLGFRTRYDEYPIKIVPYVGLGVGACGLIKTYNLNTNNPESDENFVSLLYILNTGIEWLISREISFFIEINYLHSNVLSNRKNYIPITGEAENMTFRKEIERFRYLKFSIGARFYWGQNMFFFAGFWEK